MNSNLSEAIEKVLSDERDVREATASHQKEFPFERDEESQVTRREFCNFLFLTSSALFAGAIGFAGKSVYDARFEPQFAPMKIEGAADLKPGTALNFRYPNENETAILIRTTGRRILRLRAKMHASGVSGLLCERSEPARMPVSRRRFSVANGQCFIRSAAATA